MKLNQNITIWKEEDPSAVWLAAAGLWELLTLSQLYPDWQN